METVDSKGFVHLHLHTEYSLLDGAIRIESLAERLKELGMSACAITDHGVMYGTVNFYQAMIKAGIHPIIGCECYVAPRGRHNKEGNVDRDLFHLVLLAKNQTGLVNLNRLVSAGFTEGYYYRPRIDHELLEKYHDGLIALSACLSGEIAVQISREEFSKAKETALWYDQLFGRGNYYLEIQANQIPEQARVNMHMISISNETGIPLVATNDCHYMRKEDAQAHDVLLCMQTGKHISDRDRMRMPTDDFYIKSEEEMRAFFPHLPSAIENTGKIAAMCQAQYTFGAIHLPTFAIPAPYKDRNDYFRELTEAGLKEKLACVSDPAIYKVYADRLSYELSVISSMGYIDYYLIVWDFIKFARDHDIMVGPGRGSGAGSLAAYVLGITNIDPIRYGLIFERFLNSERVSMPDFDIDFCYERRQEVIDYVTEKYGTDRVAQVISFGTLAARACVRDVARALEVPYADSDRLAKMIPFSPGMKIQEAMKISSELKSVYDTNPAAKNVLDTAMLFEGMPRHASTHAAGVVISSCPLTDLAPLSQNDDSVVVQFDKNNVEAIGLLKFDFLGLRTLTVMRDTAQMVLRNRGIVIDYDHLPMDEMCIYEMIGRGETEGVFQLESAGMTSFMMELAPTSIEDIIAGISLYRPGPMDQIPRYVKARHDASSIHYDHPLLEPILKVTYGCMVYQEQAMQIVRDVAGFSMGQSDNIRRAMSKKKFSIMNNYRQIFIYGGVDELGREVDGACRRGVPEATAKKIFDDVAQFAGYAFNKSHAAAYAVVGYTTAYLKYHFPTEFMAAMLNSYRGNLSQAAWYVGCAKRLGIRILPPDINKSQAKFDTEGDGFIRMGLSAIKNVGEGAINQLVAERTTNGEFTSFGDFLRRMDKHDMNKKMYESLVYASALDHFGICRSQMIAVLDPFVSQLQANRRNQMDGQLSLFGLSENTQDTVRCEPQYPGIEEYTVSEKLAREKEVLGLYISGHPLDAYKSLIAEFANTDSTAFSRAIVEDEVLVDRVLTDQERIVMAGIMKSRTTKTTKSKEMMAFLQMEDLFGEYEVIVFPKTFSTYAPLLQQNRVLLIRGKVSIREDEPPKLIAESVEELVQPAENAGVEENTVTTESVRASNLSKTMQENQVSDETLQPDIQEKPLIRKAHVQRLGVRFLGHKNDDVYRRMLAFLSYFHGEMPVVVFFADTKEIMPLSNEYWIDPENDILQELSKICGADNLALY